MEQISDVALPLLTSELEDLGKMLKMYVSLQSEVRWAERQTEKKVEEFTAQQKANLVTCLTQAQAAFRGAIITPADVKTKLTRVLSILEKVPVYVEPARAAAVAGVDEEGTVVSTEWIEGKFGDRHVIEIRKYADNDPRGIYQRWVDRKFNQTLPDFQEARMPAMVEMRGLLGRLDALK